MRKTHYFPLPVICHCRLTQETKYFSGILYVQWFTMIATVNTCFVVDYDNCVFFSCIVFLFNSTKLHPDILTWTILWKLKCVWKLKIVRGLLFYLKRRPLYFMHHMKEQQPTNLQITVHALYWLHSMQNLFCSHNAKELYWMFSLC